MNTASTGTISSRPIHIRNTISSFDVSGKNKYLPNGPKRPNPGPIFPIVAIDALVDSSIVN